MLLLIFRNVISELNIQGVDIYICGLLIYRVCRYTGCLKTVHF